MNSEHGLYILVFLGFVGSLCIVMTLFLKMI